MYINHGRFFDKTKTLGLNNNNDNKNLTLNNPKILYLH